MKIRIRENAASLYRANVNLGKRMNSNKWYEILKAIQGTTIEVETDYLFKDQYNTVPIPGISDLGLRVLQEDVAEVIDDARVGMMRCGWCGKTLPVGASCHSVEYMEMLS